MRKFFSTKQAESMLANINKKYGVNFTNNKEKEIYQIIEQHSFTENVALRDCLETIKKANPSVFDLQNEGETRLKEIIMLSKDYTISELDDMLFHLERSELVNNTTLQMLYTLLIKAVETKQKAEVIKLLTTCAGWFLTKECLQVLVTKGDDFVEFVDKLYNLTKDLNPNSTQVMQLLVLDLNGLNAIYRIFNLISFRNLINYVDTDLLLKGGDNAGHELQYHLLSCLDQNRLLKANILDLLRSIQQSVSAIFKPFDTIDSQSVVFNFIPRILYLGESKQLTEDQLLSMLKAVQTWILNSKHHISWDNKLLEESKFVPAWAKVLTSLQFRQHCLRVFFNQGVSESYHASKEWGHFNALEIQELKNAPKDQQLSIEPLSAYVMKRFHDTSTLTAIALQRAIQPQALSSQPITDTPPAYRP